MAPSPVGGMNPLFGQSPVSAQPPQPQSVFGVPPMSNNWGQPKQQQNMYVRRVIYKLKIFQTAVFLIPSGSGFGIVGSHCLNHNITWCDVQIGYVIAIQTMRTKDIKPCSWSLFLDLGLVCLASSSLTIRSYDLQPTKWPKVTPGRISLKKETCNLCTRVKYN